MAFKEFPLAVVLEGIDKLSGPLNKASTRIDAFGSKATALGKKFLYGFTLPVTAALGVGTHQAAEYEDAVLRFRAATGSGADAAEKLGAKVDAMPKIFDDADKFEALRVLTTRGFDAVGALDILTPSMFGARATGDELAATAKGVGLAMHAWEIDTSRAGHAVDALTVGALRSGSTISDLADRMAKAGRVSLEANQGFDRTLATIVELDRLGVDGGNTFLAAIRNLAKDSPAIAQTLAKLNVAPSELQDSTGRIRDLADVVALLSSRGADLDDFLSLFGKTAGPAFARLAREGTNSVDELVAAMGQTGAAMEAAGLLSSKFTGAMRELGLASKDALEGLGKSGLTDVLAALARLAAGALRWFAELPAPIQAFALVAALAAASVGPFLLVVGQLAGAVAGLISGFTLLAPVIVTFVAAVSPALALLAANPIVLIAAAVAALILGVTALIVYWDELMEAFRSIRTVVIAFVAPAFNWIAEKKDELLGWLFGDDEAPSAPPPGEVAAASAVRAAAGSARAVAGAPTRSEVGVRVEFENLPSIAKPRVVVSDGVDLDVSAGANLAGMGAW